MLESRFVDVEGLRLHYLERPGPNPPVLFLHGWPTSSHLWRHALAALDRRGIALDLPGFGRSDKPIDASYSFPFFQRVLDGFVAKLGLDRVSLAVHDLGGPVGLFWAVQAPERVERLAILNTFVYPQMSAAIVAFVIACRTPGIRAVMASRFGLKKALELGIRDRTKITPELVEAVAAPFATRDARRALLKAAYGLHPGGFETIVKGLPKLKGTTRLLYGERDFILPDVAETMSRLARDLPSVERTALPGCGHFLQEDRPEEVARALAEFFR